jgi:hypothetical protein
MILEKMFQPLKMYASLWNTGKREAGMKKKTRGQPTTESLKGDGRDDTTN